MIVAAGLISAIGACAGNDGDTSAPGGAGGGAGDAGSGGGSAGTGGTAGTGGFGGTGGAGGSAGTGGAAGSGGSGGTVEDGWSIDGPHLAVSPSGVVTANFSTSEPATASMRCGDRAIAGRGAGTHFSLSLALPPGERQVQVVLLPAARPDEIHATNHTVNVPQPPAAALVLFDAAHGQTSGNADWVIDHPDEAEPTPADPQTAEDWAGAYSSFGFGLHRSGRFAVRTLPRRETIDAADLRGVSVLVLPEPNNRYAAAEKQAIWSFVRAGGGLYLLANHAGSDRDDDGWDGAEVAADLLEAAGPELGIAILPADVKREDPTRALGDHALLTGPFGAVNALSFFDATTLTVAGGAAPLVRRGSGGEVLGAAATYGAGRVIVVGDSAGADDGTGWPQDNLFDGWSDYDNAAFYLNGVSWLAGEIGE